MISKKTLLVGLLAIIWGANFPVSRFLLESMDVLTVRYAASIISLGVYTIIFIPYIIGMKNIKQNDMKSILLLSIPSIFIVPLLNLYALSYLDSGSALILIYTMPAMSSFIMLLGKRSSLGKELVPVLFSIIGVLFVINQSINFGTGEAIILLSALIWAIGGLLNHRYMPSVSLIEVSFIQCLFVSICNFIVFQLFSETQWSVFTGLNFYTYLALFYVGIIAGGLAFYIWFELIKNYGASIAAYCTLWSPIVGLMIIALMTEEKVNLNLLIGGAFIVSSIYAKNTLDRKKTKKKTGESND